MVAAADRQAAGVEPEGSASAIRDPYEVVSVRVVAAPAGTSGTDWHRYEIRQGTNVIVGHRAGSFETVLSAVESIVIQLNERRRHRRGRVHVVLQPPSSASKAILGK